MLRNRIIFIIGMFLIAFVVVSVAFNMLCQPNQDNAVVNAVSSALSSPQAAQSAAQPDPFSWEPILRQLANLFSKACPR
jgi:hypothetical protein